MFFKRILQLDTQVGIDILLFHGLRDYNIIINFVFINL